MNNLFVILIDVSAPLRGNAFLIAWQQVIRLAGNQPAGCLGGTARSTVNAARESRYVCGRTRRAGRPHPGVPGQSPRTARRSNSFRLETRGSRCICGSWRHSPLGDTELVDGVNRVSAMHFSTYSACENYRSLT